MGDVSAGSILLAGLAGVLSIVSPCVLPLLPLVLGGAGSAHRYGALALAAGLIVAFVAVGLFVATIGFSIGLDTDWFREVSAILLAIVGLVLLSSFAQQKLAIATGGVGDAGRRLMDRISPAGLRGQFVVGLILGAVWSPCVGPTLGAASLLAAQGREIGTVALVMAAFAIGTAIPLVAIALASRTALLRWRGRMASAGRSGKLLLGTGALIVATFILTGFDRILETVMVDHAPSWLIDVTTRF